MYEQFKTGDLYAGQGKYGNGTYAAKDYFVSEGTYAGGPYAMSQGQGAVWRMAISPDAKTITYKELEIEMHKSDSITTFRQNATRDETTLRSIAMDPGYFAMRKGYDVIVADDQGQEFYVILNRGAVAVQDTLEREGGR